jgi:ketosteroid isomerase-like protein
MKRARIEGRSEVRELEVKGDWAFARSYLQVAMTPPHGETILPAGWALSILQKGADGRWRIARDANLLTRV